MHEQALAKAYLQQAFKGRASGKPRSGDAAGRVAIIDRAGVEKKRQFDHSWVVVSKSGPTAEDAGLTILFGAESFEKMLEPEEESPSIDHSPKRPRGPR
ncbi:hypothetical protein KIP36_09945 [Xanthomonas campestris pv. campestris]|uniref:hypothetical protein n=1 Tax=Xanthomonas campestris TaxID=339 RepID=UPI001F2D360A|nr:hypothetical protein [Xanthomonas campestris]MCF8813753.1 hypothetical protein [Xanthomonas campestris pv. campestris]